MSKSRSESKFNIRAILGIIAGFLIILTGILTALKITPPIATTGAEITLGLWRILAGTIILISSFYISKYRKTNLIILFFGAFEVLVFIVEKDYSLLTLAPFIAILAGILGLIKK